MKLSARVKKWLVENAGVKATASDDEFRKAAAEALADGTLEVGTYQGLIKSAEDDEADGFMAVQKAILDGLSDLKSLLSDPKGTKSDDEDEDEEDEIDDEDEDTVAGDGKSAKTRSTKGGTPKGRRGAPTERKSTSYLEKAFMANASYDDEDDGEEKTFSVRVKAAAEQYSTTKSAMVYPSTTEKGRPHPMSGQPVMDYNEGQARQVHTASDLDKAVAGAWSQFHIQSQILKSRSLAFGMLPQHSKELLCHAMKEMDWGGASDGGDLADIKGRRLTPSEQKALIDDSTSGGLEAAPIVFDDQVIQTPLLNGELYPLVNTIPLDRGRRIEGVQTGTVTSSWGGVDNTDIGLFNTASYVSAFDTTVFRWEGAIHIGLDFLSDTPIDFGAHTTAQYGERLLEDLDDVIAVGNGTTQPEGVMTKSGTTSVNFGAATSIGNYESLRFGVAKKEHKPNLIRTAVFCGTETSYQRMKAIPVGASDARRLFGQGGMGTGGYDDYSMMNRKYAINESMTNAQIFYAILGRYRMYRRRGLTMRTSTEGDTLIRKNAMLMVATARYGGQLERGAVAAKTSTAPA